MICFWLLKFSESPVYDLYVYVNVFVIINDAINLYLIINYYFVIRF